MADPWNPMTIPYWWQTITPSNGNDSSFGTSAQPDESWASSGRPPDETGGFVGSTGFGGLLSKLARPPYQSWPEPQSVSAGNAAPTTGIDWLGLARKIIEPITSYPETYSQMNREAREQIGHGVDQLKYVYTPGVNDPVTFIKALGNIGLGTLGYVGSPINAGLRTFAGKPVEDLTGFPKEYSEFALSLGIPGLGLRSAVSTPTAVPRSVPGKSVNDLSPAVVVRKSRYNIYDPPMKPQRPFEADYPHGTRADPSRRLIETMDGTPITARYVAGRRELGGPDVGLTPTQFEDIITRLTGRPPQKATRGSQELGEEIGATDIKFKPGTAPHLRDYRVYIDRTLNPGDRGRATGHEMSHVVHEMAGAPTPPPEVLEQLLENYSTLAAGREGARPPRTPSYFGYPSRQVLPELVVEGMRGYATNPNYFKTVAPEAAEWIRSWANANPWIRDVIQFNALTGLLAGGVDSRSWPSPQPSPSTAPNE